MVGNGIVNDGFYWFSPVAYLSIEVVPGVAAKAFFIYEIKAF